MKKIKVFLKSILLISLVTLLTLTFAQDVSGPPEEEVFEVVQYDVNGPCVSSVFDAGSPVYADDDSGNRIGSGLQNTFTFSGMNYIDEVLITRSASSPRKASSCGQEAALNNIGTSITTINTINWYLNLNNQQNAQRKKVGDQAPASYPWREKLKKAEDFAQYLKETLMYKRNEDGELIYDSNGQKIPLLDAYNCHFDAFGPNNDPNSFEVPFSKIIDYPDIGAYREVGANEKSKLEIKLPILYGQILIRTGKMQ